MKDHLTKEKRLIPWRCRLLGHKWGRYITPLYWGTHHYYGQDGWKYIGEICMRCGHVEEAEPVPEKGK